MNSNPFTPNFGQVPQHIAGREEIIAEVFSSLEDPGRNPASTSIFVGARGTGKTALLSFFAEECKSRGWVSANATCIPGLQEDILLQAGKAAQELIGSKYGRKIKGVSVGQLFGLEWETEDGIKPNWRMQMEGILDALEEHGTGLLITIDEIDPNLDEMIQVAAVYQHMIRENRRVALLMAGLPSEVSALLNDRTVSFLRRANKYTLERVSDSDVMEAYVRTIEDVGGRISNAALQESVEAIEGFPYMLQLVGYRSWQHSKKGKIDIKEAEMGITEAKRDFNERVLKASVEALSDGDRVFLQAMLKDDGVSNISDIEKRMKKTPGYVSRYRGRLIEQGIIMPAGRGKVTFALPGLKEYLMSE